MCQKKLNSTHHSGFQCQRRYGHSVQEDRIQVALLVRNTLILVTVHADAERLFYPLWHREVQCHHQDSDDGAQHAWKTCSMCVHHFKRLCRLFLKRSAEHILVRTCGQSQPERVAVPGLKRVVSYGENTLRHVHGGGEGRHGAEYEGGGGQHHVPCVQDDRHAEEDVGQQPAKKRRPGGGNKREERRFYVLLRFLL